MKANRRKVGEYQVNGKYIELWLNKIFLISFINYFKNMVKEKWNEKVKVKVANFEINQLGVKSGWNI